MNRSVRVDPDDHEEDDADPFRLLVAGREGAHAHGGDPVMARSRALDVALRIIKGKAEKDAAFYFRQDPYQGSETVQLTMISLSRLCGAIYDGTAEPPDNWKAYIARSVNHKHLTVLGVERRHGGRGLDTGQVVSLDQAEPGTQRPRADSLSLTSTPGGAPGAADVADTAMERIRVDAVLRRLGRLLGDINSGVLACAFHPGRRCRHLRTGRIGGTCPHLSVVLRALPEDVLQGDREWTHGLLIAWTGYDSHRQGAALRRHVYRCLDWFSYLAERDTPFWQDSSMADLAGRENILFDHLLGTGSDAPSATTVCILMNDHPELTIPARLMLEHGRVHLDRPRGEAR